MHQGLRAIRRAAIAKLPRGIVDAARLRAGRHDVINSVLDHGRFR